MVEATFTLAGLAGAARGTVGARLEVKTIEDGRLEVSVYYQQEERQAIFFLTSGQAGALADGLRALAVAAAADA